MRVPGDRRTMTLPASRPGAVVLLLAAGLAAALFAVTAFAPQPAGAQSRTLTNIIEVDGGRSSKMVFKVTPPSEGADYLDYLDEIKITLPSDFTPTASKVDKGKIKFSSSGDGPTAPLPATEDGTISNRTLTLSIPAGVAPVGADDHLVIIIEANSGITAPETPKGFDDDKDGYRVDIIFVDTSGDKPDYTARDTNIIVVKNPLSSTVPGATVRVDLFTYAEAPIGPGQEITVDFSGPSADYEFAVPASIFTSRITIDPKVGGSFSPSDVLVQGARVILTIPVGTTTPRSVPEGEYEIRFSQLARIRNPFAAGNQIITVSSTAPGDEPDEITAVIKRTTTINPQEGPRGTEFELEGKGYARGTVTIYHDANDNKLIDAGETLAAVNTVNGAFSVDLEAHGETHGQPVELEYRVRTRDSEGAEDEIVFHIESGMFFKPAAARVGSPLQITISDWQNLDQEVAVVSVAGETAYVATINRYDNCFEYKGIILANPDRTITLEIDVPPNVPAGEQTVSLYGLDALDPSLTADKKSCEGQGRKGALVSSDKKAKLRTEAVAIIKTTIDIDTSELTLSPATAARGSKVTITGSGFTRARRGSDHIASVWIGGKKVVDDHSGFEVGSNGDIAFPVTVPLDIPNGPNEVRIEGTDHTLGQGVLTVPEATISLDPPMGQRGTDFTITGSGFIANEPVFVTYGAGVGAPLGEAQFGGILADGRGGFELLFQVPITAEVGKRHLITAVAQEEIRGAAVTVEAEASHLIMRANITTTPNSVSPGDRLTVSGQGLPAFTLVGPISIAGIELSLGSQVATDEAGNFETEVVIPRIDFSDHTLLVQVAGVIIPEIVNVAPPPLTGPPDQVFKYLIRDGVLSVVWRYDNATQSWGLFDPSLTGALADLNDLTEVGSGDIVFMNLLQPQYFQGSGLTAGWNLVELK